MKGKIHITGSSGSNPLARVTPLWYRLNAWARRQPGCEDTGGAVRARARFAEVSHMYVTVNVKNLLAAFSLGRANNIFFITSKDVFFFP